MEPIERVLRKHGSPDIYIRIRQENAETFIATLEKVGKTSVQTWPAIGPAAVAPVFILKTYENENPGYAFVPLP